MIFIFDLHFTRTSPIWLVKLLALAFAYRPAERECGT
jgi:hypothetical protein